VSPSRRQARAKRRASGFGAVLIGLLGALCSADSARAATEGGPPPEAPPAWVVLDQRAADGEQCIVCKLPIQAGEIVEVRYKGRRFFVAAKMLSRFEADPETYFHALQAHGGLFDEAAMETPPMRTGWLFFGLYLLVGLVAGAGCSYVAIDRGLPAWGWFFAGLAANVLAVGAVLTRARRAGVAAAPGLTKIPITHAPVACSACDEPHHPAASACASCGHDLVPTVEPETART
jgi:hypothetical protein